MIYFRQIESIEKTKKNLEKKTDKFKPLLSVYEEGFYSKQLKSVFDVMYENGNEIKSISKSNIRPHFYGICFTFNEKQYLFGVIGLDLIVLLFTLSSVLFGFLIFDIEESAFALLMYFFFLILTYKDIRVLKEFLDTL